MPRTKRPLQFCLAACAALTCTISMPAREITCATCHRAEAQSQPRNAMGRATELPADQDILKAHPKLTFQKDGYIYSVERKGGHSVYTVRDGTGELSLPIEYAMGVHNQTFVLQYQGHFYESQVSYFERLQGLEITLGDEKRTPHNLVEAMGRETPNKEITECFACHATNAVHQRKLTLDSLQPGVTCEHCHTGARAHMQAIAQGKTAPLPANLDLLGAEDMSNFCGQCHRTWAAIVRLREWGNVNVRFAPYRLANSECFLGDDRRIRCVACHNPHESLARDPAAYDHACLACHRSAPQKSCPISHDRCVTCHMPKVALAGSHAIFTDHQIRVVHPGDAYPN